MLLATLLHGVSINAQESTAQKIEAYMDAQARFHQFGGTVLVSRNDSVMLKKAYGLADMEWHVENTIDAKFVLASVTKYVTAIGIMQLAERHKLALNDKLSKFFPGYPKGEQVTLHMLLTHTSGLAMDFDEIYMNSTSISKDSAIGLLQKKPYLFEPGTNCKYSNIGYFLLSQIIERVSGQAYEAFLKQHIFDKAQMSNTGVCNNDSIIPKKAKVYCRNGDAYVHNPYINWNLNVGLDGLYSTVEDLHKLNRPMQGTTILSEGSKQLMQTQHNKAHPDGNFMDAYGYGIFIDPYYNHGHHLLTHSGGFMGTMATFDSYPDDHLFVVVLSNNQSSSHLISYGLAGILFGLPVELPYLRREVAVEAAVLKTYTGKYAKLEIIYQAGQLYLNDLDTPLLPESTTKFFIKNNPDKTLEFMRDKQGKVNALLVRIGGVGELKPRLLK